MKTSCYNLRSEAKVKMMILSGSSDNEESNVSSPEAAVLNSEWYQRHVQTVLSEVLSPSDGDKADAHIDEETEIVEHEAEKLIDSKEEVAAWTMAI